MAFCDLLTYELTDFLMFAPTTYVRLIERYNEALWPSHLFIAFSGLVCGAWLHARRDSRLVFLTLAAGWMMVAYGFFMVRYATIMSAAPVFATIFMAQAVLFTGLAFKPSLMPFDDMAKGRRMTGLSLVGIAFLAYPLVALLAGRGLLAGEFPGLMPEPTVLATLGVCLTSRESPWWLYVIPFFWVPIGALTLLAMDMPDWWVLPALLVIGFITLIFSRLTFEETVP